MRVADMQGRFKSGDKESRHAHGRHNVVLTAGTKVENTESKLEPLEKLLLMYNASDVRSVCLGEDCFVCTENRTSRTSPLGR